MIQKNKRLCAAFHNLYSQSFIFLTVSKVPIPSTFVFNDSFFALFFLFYLIDLTEKSRIFRRHWRNHKLPYSWAIPYYKNQMEISHIISCKAIFHQVRCPVSSPLKRPHPPCMKFASHMLTEWMWAVCIPTTLLNKVDSEAFRLINTHHLTDCLQFFLKHRSSITRLIAFCRFFTVIALLNLLTVRLLYPAALLYETFYTLILIQFTLLLHEQNSFHTFHQRPPEPSN